MIGDALTTSPLMADSFKFVKTSINSSV